LRVSKFRPFTDTPELEIDGIQVLFAVPDFYIDTINSLDDREYNKIIDDMRAVLAAALNKKETNV
jgi:hypothetical protein